jgi:hypothetical protein
MHTYSGRKITESLGNVTVRGEKDGKSKGGARLSTVCLSMRSVTENIYCSQLSSVALLLQPEPNCFTSYITRKGLCYLSLCAIVLRSSLPSHVSSCNGQRSSQLFCVHYTHGAGLAQSVQCLTTGWTTGRSGFDPRQGQSIFPLSSVSRPALGPIQSPLQWVPGVVSPGVKARSGRDADHSPPSNAEVVDE